MGKTEPSRWHRQYFTLFQQLGSSCLSFTISLLSLTERVQGRDTDRSRRKSCSVCWTSGLLMAYQSPKYLMHHKERLKYRAPRKKMVQLSPKRTVFVYVCQSFQLFIRTATDGARQTHALFHSFLQNEQMSSLHATWPRLTKCDKKQR